MGQDFLEQKVRFVKNTFFVVFPLALYKYLELNNKILQMFFDDWYSHYISAHQGFYMGQLELLPPNRQMAENLVNCTQYQTKELNPLYAHNTHCIYPKENNIRKTVRLQVKDCCLPRIFDRVIENI